MSSMPDLPGFYYDQERKRYFRIMNTGQATSQASNDYSISAVAEVRRRKRKHLESNHQHQSLYSPYTIKKHLLGSCLGPRINRFSQNATVISSLSKKAHWTFDMASASDNLTCLSWCEREKLLIVGTKHGKCSLIPGNQMVNRSNLSLNLQPPPTSSYYPIESFNSEITSLSLSGNTIVTTCLGGPATTGAFSCTLLKSYADVGIVYKLPEHKNAFCSAVLEDKSGPNTYIAVGTNECAYVTQPHLNGFYKEPFRTDSDVLAIEFLNDHLLTAGCRNGSLNVFDTRIRNRHLTPTPPVVNVYHTSAVTHIKSVQDSRYILVSGLEDSLALYDLRYTKSHIPTKSPYHNNTSVQATKPTITYYGYSNSHTLHHGFSVDSTNKNLAIASDNGKINVYNIWTGTNLTGSQLKHYHPPSLRAISSLQWTPIGGLFIGFGCNLEYWSWSSFDDEI